ncbi:response regulator [Streptomyces sp. NPDC004732]|uniref:response regulator n=1 Tax=Streptomyces sp. NPDC004732 TaxID=3154290 RepID=UPI00339FBA1D
MPGVPGRVLVVDDNKVIRQLIRVNLELEGYEVVTAADGVECLDVVQEVQPDVVTLDVVMPRLDGLRTAARLRSDARTRNLPIVVISACTQYEVESGLEVGVDAFLAKPFEPNELVGIVRQLMAVEGEGQGEDEPEGVAVGRELGRGASGSECRTSGGCGGGGAGEAERAAQHGG